MRVPGAGSTPRAPARGLSMRFTGSRRRPTASGAAARASRAWSDWVRRRPGRPPTGALTRSWRRGSRRTSRTARRLIIARNQPALKRPPGQPAALPGRRRLMQREPPALGPTDSVFRPGARAGPRRRRSRRSGPRCRRDAQGVSGVANMSTGAAGRAQYRVVCGRGRSYAKRVPTQRAVQHSGSGGEDTFWPLLTQLALRSDVRVERHRPDAEFAAQFGHQRVAVDHPRRLRGVVRDSARASCRNAPPVRIPVLRGRRGA